MTSPCVLPDVEVIDGGQQGPRLGILGGVHGNEYGGVLAARRLADIMRDRSFRGQLRIAAPAHPAAWAAHTRVCPEDGLNLARVFPGSSTGAPSEHVAAHLVEHLIDGCDLLVDLHTAGAWSDMPMLAGYQAEDRADAEVSHASGAAVAAFAAPFTWQHPTVSAGRSLSAAQALGVPSFYVESAGSGRVLLEQQKDYVDGLLRVMRHLGMTDDAPAARHRSVVVRSEGNTDPGGAGRDGMVVASAGGYYLQRVNAGDYVDEGDLLGELHDDRGRILDAVVSPREGIVMMARTDSRVSTDDALAIVAHIVG